MRLFVTGGTGFLGSHFIKVALENGHSVVALKRRNSNPRITLVEEPDWIEGELDDDWGARFAECDAVYHFAAQGVSPQETDWKRAIETNVTKSTLLVSNALDNGVKNIIVCGSGMEYGRSGEHFDLIPTNAPLEPIGPYAVSKAAFSVILASLARTSDASIQLLRPFNLYGEGQHESNFWPSLRLAALTGQDYQMSPGEQVRDYMSVENAAQMFLVASSSQTIYDRALMVRNIGSGYPISLKDFAQNCWEKWNAKGKIIYGAIPYRKDEIMRYVPLVEK